MNIPIKLIVVLVLPCISFSVYADQRAHELELSKEIEQSIALNEEVLAWKEVVEDVGGNGTGHFFSNIQTPELRMKAEQDERDDALRIGGALRWRLDKTKAKSIQKAEIDGMLNVHELRLFSAEWKVRNELKSTCLRAAFLRTQLGYSDDEVDILEARLSTQKELLKLQGTEVFSVLKAKKSLIEAKEAKESFQSELAILEGGLMDKGISSDILSQLYLDEKWTVNKEEIFSLFEDSSKDDGLNGVIDLIPEVKLQAIKATGEELKHMSSVKENRFGLSYVQIQYEEENDQDKDDRETSFGLSFGLRLPSRHNVPYSETLKRNGQSARNLRVKNEVESSLLECFDAWSHADANEQRLSTDRKQLVAELEDLLKTLSDNSAQLEASQRFSVEKELLELQSSILTLNYETLEAAIKLENELFRELVVLP